MARTWELAKSRGGSYGCAMSTDIPVAPIPSNATQRLVSLDALRGFDMLWLLGMEELGAAIGKASSAQHLSTQLTHVTWAGFRFLDLVFPLFVFIAGVSSVFSLEKSLATHGRAATLKKLVVRALILYVLGLWCYGGISKGIDEIRWMGVLQRIALAGLGGGLAYLYLGRRARWGLCGGLVVWRVISLRGKIWLTGLMPSFFLVLSGGAIMIPRGC